MRRLVAAALAATALSLAPAASPSAAAPASWAQAQIREVTAAGLMGGDAASFRAADPMTAGDLADLVSGLTGRAPVDPAEPDAPVSMARLDAQLVRALGLDTAAREFATALRSVGLAPPSAFGTETVARLLGLRTNHPTRLDALELRPQDVATRAEAAYSAARILELDDGDLAALRASADAFAPGTLDEPEREVLRTAVSLIGYPYVWGGTSENQQAPFGKTVPGGFDCSGFVWRVYKLGAAAGTPLADTLRGRTTYEMSGEVPRAERIPFAELEPGDVVFFGTHGPRSRPAEVYHAGIYLGGGWMIHSSDFGVALAPITDGWYRAAFAWARRPLAEAGLTG